MSTPRRAPPVRRAQRDRRRPRVTMSQPIFSRRASTIVRCSGRAPGQRDVAAGDRARRQKGARLDAIGDVRRTRLAGVSAAHALDRRSVFVPAPAIRAPSAFRNSASAASPARPRRSRSRSCPRRAPRPSSRCRSRRRSRCRRRCAPPRSSRRLGDDVAVLEVERRAERLHRVLVQIHRARSPGAAAGQRDPRAPEAGQQRARGRRSRRASS